MDSENRIKILAENLIRAINQAYTDNTQIRRTLHQIEEEGYQADVVLAAFTRLDKSSEPPSDSATEEPVDEKMQTSILDLGMAATPWNENPEEPPHRIRSDINDFDRAFLKLIKVRIGDETDSD